MLTVRCAWTLEAFIAALALTTSLLMPHAGYAQGELDQTLAEMTDEEAASYLSELSLEDLLQLMSESASKNPETASSAPASVIVLSRERLRVLGVSRFTQLLNLLPGYHTTVDGYQGSHGRYSVRGISHQSGILVLVDGERINDYYSDGLHFSDRHIVIDDIERIEIIRGPGSALYGSNAFIGVINIKTLRGKNFVKASAGNLNRRGVTLQTTHTAADAVKLSTVANYYEDDGYNFATVSDRWGTMTRAQDPIVQSDLGLRLAYRDLTFYGHYSARQHNGFQGFGGVDPQNYIDTRKTMVRVRYQNTLLDERVELDSNASYHRHWLNARSLFAPANELTPEAYYLAPSYDISGAEGRVHGRYRHSERSVFNAGLDYRYIKLMGASLYVSHDPATMEAYGEIRELAGAQSYIKPGVSRHALGSYAQVQHTLAERLRLTVGGRADYYSDFGLALSPRLAVVYSTPLKGYAKLLFGRAFRAPNIRELYTRNNPVVIGNTELAAETIRTAELSYTQHIGEVVRAQVAGYYNDVDGLIELGDVAADGSSRPFQNRGARVSAGVEAEVEVLLRPGYALTGSYSYVPHYRVDGERADMEHPEHAASATVTYTRGPLTASVSGYARSKSAAFALQDRYIIVNGHAVWQLSDAFAVAATVENIGDTVLIGRSEIFTEGTPNRGRMYYVSLQYEQE